MVPGVEQLAVRIEDLDPVVFTVAHIRAIFGVELNRMDRAELARSGSRRAPRHDELSSFIELRDAAVAVPVGNIGVALRIPRDVGRAPERLIVVATHTFR